MTFGTLRRSHLVVEMRPDLVVRRRIAATLTVELPVSRMDRSIGTSTDDLPGARMEYYAQVTIACTYRIGSPAPVILGGRCLVNERRNMPEGYKNRYAR